MQEKQRIYLSLGSNLGDRATNLERAIAMLAGSATRVLRRSLFYATEPVGFLDQPWFLNCVIEAETTLAPLDLLVALQGITRDMGSRKLVPQGPRIIDLDILLYGNEIIQTADLVVPHPRMASRRFVLVPLAELAPELRHPLLGVTVVEMLAGTPDKSEVRIWQGQSL